MEQFQNVLEIIKKYHFWILAGLVLVISLGIYTLAVGKAKTEFDKRKKKIDSAFTGAKNVPVDTPNQGKIDNWESTLDKQRNAVLEAWKLLYQNQEKEKQWPKGLGESFQKMIKKIGPKDEIAPQFRQLYRNTIPVLVPDELFGRVDYRHPKDENAKMPLRVPMRDMRRVGMEGVAAPEMQVEMIGVVEWPQTERDKIIKEQFNFSTQPSTFEIRLAQENYWVYQTLLDIIKKTNGDAATPGSAAVKEIDALQIGKEAANTIRSDQGPDLIAVVSAKTGGAGGHNTPAGNNTQYHQGSASGGDPGTTPVMDGTTQLSPADVELLKDRYVDEKLATIPPGQHPYSEFKMMPVLMRLRIDQRKISDLLVECANATMPVEVKNYRMNPGGTTPSAKGGKRLHGEGGESMMAPAARKLEAKDDPHVVTIEIRGIIYLYNPPDANAVGKGTLAEQATAGAADATATTETAPKQGETTPPDIKPDTPEKPKTPETPNDEPPPDF